MVKTQVYRKKLYRCILISPVSVSSACTVPSKSTLPQIFTLGGQSLEVPRGASLHAYSRGENPAKHVKIFEALL